ncbi:MAG: hypothetical protein AAGG56_12320 [Pseudomonadota bacterium]
MSFENAGSGTIPPGRFVGPVLAFDANPPVRIARVAVHPSTNFPGFTEAYVSVRENALWINTTGLTVTPATTLFLTLDLDA